MPSINSANPVLISTENAYFAFSHHPQLSFQETPYFALSLHVNKMQFTHVLLTVFASVSAVRAMTTPIIDLSVPLEARQCMAVSQRADSASCTTCLSQFHQIETNHLDSVPSVNTARTHARLALAAAFAVAQ